MCSLCRWKQNSVPSGLMGSMRRCRDVYRCLLAVLASKEGSSRGPRRAGLVKFIGHRRHSEV